MCDVVSKRATATWATTAESFPPLRIANYWPDTEVTNSCTGQRGPTLRVLQKQLDNWISRVPHNKLTDILSLRRVLSERGSPANRPLAPEILPVTFVLRIAALDVPIRPAGLRAAWLEVLSEQQRACCDACHCNSCQRCRCLGNRTVPRSIACRTARNINIHPRM